ncbi:putative transcriptional regulator [Desulfohalotomaculum tongense]|uniref:CBS domain-containing protein n=1 Tax=Desulforadius tongensis TaxID=1216062 RepID=UPI0019598698|nr:CBS domain-containing protein [Desulforadius tongensis]MBM7853995.1 putative transcriptional regulator [Desulforadius tongensis]
MSSSDKKVAKDIMVPSDRYPVIYEDETIKRVLSKFQFSLCSKQSKRRNLLVLNRNDEPIGWVTLRDILAAVHPSNLDYTNKHKWNLQGLTGPSAYFARELMNWVSNDTLNSLADQCQKISNLRVDKLVRPLESGAVHAETPLNAVASIMYEKNLSTLPVVENGKLVGFVRAEDIIMEMASILINTTVNKKNQSTPAAKFSEV